MIQNHHSLMIWIGYTAGAYLIGKLCDMGIRRHLQNDEIPTSAWITCILTAIFLWKDGYTIAAIRNIMIAQVWLTTGVYDGILYEIPDVFHVLLFGCGLIQIQWVPALLGMLLVPLPFFLTALMTNGKIGGGDIKLMMATGFAIGVTRGFQMMLLGLLFGILWHVMFQREKDSLPLAPFLGTGGLVVLLFN